MTSTTLNAPVVTTKLRLKDKFHMTPEEKAEVNRLVNLFSENDSKLLRGGKLKPSDKQSLQDLRFKYLNFSIGYRNPVDVELDDLKRDHFNNQNTNKPHWVLAYMLTWIAYYPNELSVEDLFRQITSKESARLILSEAYEIKYS